MCDPPRQQRLGASLSLRTRSPFYSSHPFTHSGRYPGRWGEAAPMHGARRGSALSGNGGAVTGYDLMLPPLISILKRGGRIVCTAWHRTAWLSTVRIGSARQRMNVCPSKLLIPVSCLIASPRERRVTPRENNVLSASPTRMKSRGALPHKTCRIRSSPLTHSEASKFILMFIMFNVPQIIIMRKKNHQF